MVFGSSAPNTLNNKLLNTNVIEPNLTLVCFVNSFTEWPNLAKFRHFGKTSQVFGKILTVYLLFGKMLSLLWQIFYIIGLMAKF